MYYIIIRVNGHKHMVSIQPHGLCQTTINGRIFARSKLLKLIEDIEASEHTRLPTTLAIRPHVWVQDRDHILGQSNRVH